VFKLRKIKEFVIEKLILLSGILTILFVMLIFAFLLKEGIAFFSKVGIKNFIFEKYWYPISSPPRFGMLPLMVGSIMVTLGATIIAVPISIMAAFYVAEVAHKKTRDFFKIGIELLSAIPSVVLGFIGVITLVPMIKKLFNVPTGLTAMTGSVILAFMAMPTIVSIAEDAITAVPAQYKEGALAMGATRWQTIYRVIFPAAMPGIIAAVMLGIGRVIGETMAVMMITGNAAVIPHTFFQPVRTMTATIAAEMGETVQGSLHYSSLFAIGIILFLITFLINLTADFFVHRIRKKL